MIAQAPVLRGPYLQVATGPAEVGQNSSQAVAAAFNAPKALTGRQPPLQTQPQTQPDAQTPSP
jgi:hypothetical protein